MAKGRHPLTQFTIGILPFSDAVSDDLSLRQLLRLSLFQVSVGMAAVMLLGTLNRVMIVELSVAAWIVALMIALPVASGRTRIAALSGGSGFPSCGLGRSTNSAGSRLCLWR